MHTLNRCKRLCIILVVVLTLIIGLACEKDSGTAPEKNDSILGSWRLVDVVLKDTPVGDMTLSANLFLEMSETGAQTSTMQFNEDGSAALITTYENNSSDTVPGIWSKDGDELTIGGAGIDDTVGCDVDGNSLTLTMSMLIDFDSDGTPEDITVDMNYTRL